MESFRTLAAQVKSGSASRAAQRGNRGEVGRSEEDVDIKPGSAVPLPRPRASEARRSADDDMRDERRFFGARTSLALPPSHRRGVQQSKASADADTARVNVEGRARGGSLAEDSSACWMPVCPSSSAPAASEPGAARAGGVDLSA